MPHPLTVDGAALPDCEGIPNQIVADGTDGDPYCRLEQDA